MTKSTNADIDLGSVDGRQPVVLHIVTDSFSATIAVAPLAQCLAFRGWRNVIVCSGKRYDDAHSFIHTLRAIGLDIRDLHIPRTIRPLADLRRVIDLWLLIRRERPSVVHTHFAKGGVVGRLAACLARVPCIHTVYDYAFVEHRGLRRWVYRAVERRTAVLARRILFISESERQVGLKERVGQPDQLITVGWGVNLHKFNPTDVSPERVSEVKRLLDIQAQRVVVGTVARLVRRKGIDLLLRAAAMLPVDSVDWHLLIVGGGPLHRGLRELVKDLGIAGRVSFTGFVDEVELMPLLLGAMDVFCLPSRREGYGMAYAEASAMAIPVVAPNAPPMNALVVEGVTGLLTRPEDPASIASALCTLLTDGKLRKTMGCAGRRFATTYCDIGDALGRAAAVYDEIMQCPRAVQTPSQGEQSGPANAGVIRTARAVGQTMPIEGVGCIAGSEAGGVIRLEDGSGRTRP